MAHNFPYVNKPQCKCTIKYLILYNRTSCLKYAKFIIKDLNAKHTNIKTIYKDN
jgi:hypothetical protein